MNILLIIILCILCILLIGYVKNDKRKIKEKLKEKYSAKPGYIEMRAKVGVILLVFFALINLAVELGFV